LELAENKETHNRMDGPCKGLLEFMKKTNYEAPHNWNGFRPAEGGGGH